MVVLCVFMLLVEYLKYFNDIFFVLKFMYKFKLNLCYNLLDWLIENVKDKKELLFLFEDKVILEDVR